ncbi:MAG: N-acetylglucosamine-6-phosphate deacetylase [Erysipelotrichaceae bacterium]|nr:N-acetylglucosamine-6-phosphate deacetylase [Erysipelotrichaceae bacterium]
MIIKSRRVYICGDLAAAAIETENGIITRILPYETEADTDFGDLRILPGFIDIHCHGAYGFDTNYADPQGLRKWTAGIVSEGVTGLLATTVTEKKEVLLKAVRNVADVVKEGYEGARILGIHFEGPYLDMDYKGAQPPEAIVPPTIEEFKEYQEAADNLIRVITLAPEHDPDFALTRYASSHGVTVSMGHSAATYQQALMAVANGAGSITHTYNAMTPLKHRENGLVGAALRMSDLYSEIICDCNHSTPQALRIFFEAKNADKAIMISDSLMCKGFETGRKFLFGGHEIEIYPDGSAHLVKEKNLAGSTMKMNEGLRNLVERALVPFDKAVNACTINPASLLGMDDHIGKIQAGYDCDLAVLNDDYSVRQTFCKGKPML